MDDLPKMSENFCLEEISLKSLSKDEVEHAEEKLLAKPADFGLRARLLSYYSQLSYEQKLASNRLSHLRWFISNIPDHTFCGDGMFYLSSAEPGYVEIGDLWLKQISSSKNLMRRVNAYMYFATNSDPNTKEYFHEFFSGQTQNVWIQALATPSGWMDGPIGIEREQIMPSDALVQELTSKADSTRKKLTSIADHASREYVEYSKFQDQLKILEQCENDLGANAFILGYTMIRTGANSFVGLNPELALLRFKGLCWVVRHIPGSSFARRFAAIQPFFKENSLVPIEEFNDVLVDLWSDKIGANCSDKKTHLNAAFFVTTFRDLLGSKGKQLVEKLSATPLGRDALTEAAKCQ